VITDVRDYKKIYILVRRKQPDKIETHRVVKSNSKIFFSLFVIYPSLACAVLLSCTRPDDLGIRARHFAVKAVHLCAVGVRVRSLKLFVVIDTGGS
jgi:hypothetical protein